MEAFNVTVLNIRRDNEPEAPPASPSPASPEPPASPDTDMPDEET